MTASFSIQRAAAADAPEVTALVGELLAEIMQAIGEQAFHFDPVETTLRLQEFLEREKYVVFIARHEQSPAAGFIALSESHALYAEGALGIIPELYVRPAHRGTGLGRRLVAQARDFGATRGWKRLEVTTPPLPAFERTLQFYEREGFSISGGRKLKMSL